jgi:hypothetical protein
MEYWHRGQISPNPFFKSGEEFSLVISPFGDVAMQVSLLRRISGVL